MIIHIYITYMQYSNIHGIFLKLNNNRDVVGLAVRGELTILERGLDMYSGVIKKRVTLVTRICGLAVMER